MNTEKKWYAVYTRPKCEKKVSQMLSLKNIENYCPLNKVQRQWSDRRKTIFEPLFHSYVFVYTNMSEHSKIKEANGVINLVYWLGNPAVVRDEEIDAIRTFLNRYDNVTLQKSEVNVDDHIRVTGGPLHSREGNVIEVRNSTVKIYLPTLGYHMLAQVHKNDIQVINDFEFSHPLAS